MPRRLLVWSSILVVLSLFCQSIAPAVVGAAEPETPPAVIPSQEPRGAPAVPTPYPTPNWPEAAEWLRPQYSPSIEPPLPVESLGLPAMPAETATGVTPADPADGEQPGIPPGLAVALIAPSGGQARFGNLPLTLTAAAGAFTETVEARLEVLGSDVAGALSPAGLALQLEFKPASRSNGPAVVPQRALSLTLDYSQLPLRYGGSFADRLTLHRFVGCGWRTHVPEPPPGLPPLPGAEQQVLECAQTDALPVVNDRANRRLIITLAEPTPAKGQERQAGMEAAEPAPGTATTTGSLSGVIYALTSGPSGPQGSYAATPLANVADYQVGLLTGAAETGYPIPVPPAAAGPAPDVRLVYNSGSVDGMNTSKNNQPGWVGIGWSLQSGAIVRHLKTCNQPRYDYQGNLYYTKDLCLTGDNFTITLNGVTSRLVNAGGNLYRLQNDLYWKLELRTDGPSGHPDTQKEYWLVTTPDGTKYRFGGETEPETGFPQQSAFYVTVYDLNACSGYPQNYLCDKVWQWNLDRVEDSNGNVTSYYYERETNYYNGLSDNTLRRKYVKAGHLSRIEYTKRVGQSSQPHARVLFHTELRCTDPTTASGCAWPSAFPDTPNDLTCEATGSCTQNAPTFWSQRRLDSVQTQTYDQAGATWKTAAIYDLAQGFPNPPTDAQGDTSEKKLWLESLTQRPGGNFSRTAFQQIEAEYYDAQATIGTQETQDVGQGQNVGWIDPSDYLLYKQVDFGSGANQVLARVASPNTGGVIEFRLDSVTGTQIGQVTVPNTAGWQNWTSVTATLTSAAGLHDLYLVFRNTGLNLNWFRFKPSGALPGLPAMRYGATMLANRLDYAPTGVSPMYMPRVQVITATLGAQVTFTYGQSHPCPPGGPPLPYVRLPYDCFPAYDAYTVPNGWVFWHKYKVTQLQVGDTFSGNDTQTYTYAYSAPTWHYYDDPTDPTYGNTWNDFRGHEVVTVTDASGAKTEYRFYRGMNGDYGGYSANITLSDNTTRTDENWLRGQSPELRRLKSNDSAVSRDVTWYTATLTAGSGVDGAYFVGLQAAEHTLYGTYSKTTRTEYHYDSYGNLDGEVRRGDPATESDNRNLQWSYVYSTTAYIVNRPQWEKLWPGNAPGSSGQELAYMAYAYDGQAVGAPPSKGNLTLTRAYTQATPAYLAADTTTVYDAWGRPTSVTDPLGHPITTTYHSFYGYAQAITNTLGHATSTVYDPRWGAPTGVTDPNNRTTTLQYDGYGRLVKAWLPTEPTNGPASREYTYTLSAWPAAVQSRQLLQATGPTYLDSWTYYDGLGRALQSQQPALDANQRVVASQRYNGLGQLQHASPAYQISGAAGGGYVAPAWTTLANYQYYSYNELGQQWLAETKSYATTLWSDVTIFDAWWQRHYDPNGKRQDTYLDVFGQAAQVVEFNTSPYTTTYTFNLAGNLTGVTDAAGNASSMTYDLLGRKTAMSDPDMGSWQYQYDGAGNLTAQRDGLNRWLYLEYDALNRLTRKRQDSPTGTLIAEWLYDAATQKGLLAKTRAYSSQGMTEVFNAAYDARNRLTQQQYTVPGTGGGTFRFDYGYNAADQRTSLRYPGGSAGQQGELVTYSYNAVGQLNQAVSDLGTQYVAATTYNPTGQVTAQQLDVSPNGLTRQYVYETNTLRLSVHKAGTASPWENLQKLTYTYDNAGNVRAITDTVNSGQAQTFSYDWLNRLTAAATTAVGTGQYSHSYVYNAIGNITSYNGNAYTYGTKPHAVTAAFGNSYSYDAVGNQTGRTVGGVSYTQTFDYENRLIEVKQGVTSLATFLYDADGNRVKGTVGGVTTVYIAGLYEWQNGATTKYYEGGALRRAGYASQNGVFYTLADQLRSTSVLVNQNGTVNGRNYFYPYGGNRNGAFSGLTTKRFTGQYHEASLPGGEGLAYYNARWYDSRVGAFISADTIVPSPLAPQTLNRYAYARGNPLRYVDPTGHYECEDADCSAIAFTPGGYVYFNPGYSPLFHLISILQRGTDSAAGRMIAVLADTSELNTTGDERIDRFLGFAVSGNFRHLGGEKGDRGFKVSLGDEHWYHEVWGEATAKAKSRQVGHFLSAINMGMRLSPGGLIVGHEQAGDQDIKGQLVKAAAAQYNGGAMRFQLAAALALQNDTAGMDALLEPLLGQTPYVPTYDRQGNSLEDLRLSAFGYSLGMQVSLGLLHSNRDVANWIALNVSEGY